MGSWHRLASELVLNTADEHGISRVRYDRIRLGAEFEVRA